MRHRSLIDSWFPGDLPEPADLEDMYPARPLPDGARVTRFAPSPTGALHLGGLYTALLSQEFAHAGGGVFLLRVEDTDSDREVPGAAREIERLLALFGPSPDEYDPDGAWGPYRQSAREHIYLAYVRELTRQGRAYPCFCTPELLAESARGQRASRSPIGYYGKWAICRDLDPAAADQRIRAGHPYTIRMRCPVTVPGRVRLHDMLRGPLTMLDNGSDPVILKSARGGSRLPTYHFAHVVDDHLMRVNLVVRGEEWLSSLPLHRQLHQALGFEPPQYAHIAPLMKVEGSSRRKLSKRKDPEAAVAYFDEAGVPAAAIRHYLRGLANSPLLDLPPDQAAGEPVRPERIGLSGAMVDLARMRSLSREHIAALSPQAALAQLTRWADRFDVQLAQALRTHPDIATRALDLAGTGGSGGARKDLACWSEFRAAYGFCLPGLHEPVRRPDDDRFAPLAEDTVRELAGLLLCAYRHTDSAEAWLSGLRAAAAEAGFARDASTYRRDPHAYRGSFREVAQVLRVCLTGRPTSPDLFDVARLLGEDEVRRRLRGLATAVRSAA